MVARDGFVSWDGSRYGVHWQWVGAIVQVGQRAGTVEIWAEDQRLAVHPRADGRPVKEALAVQVPVGQVERRSLEVYELAATGGVR